MRKDTETEIDEPVEGSEQAPATPLPRIYVASLTDYNDAVLHGAWIDLDGDQDRLWQEVNAMLASSPTARHYGERAEEWVIHDYEHFGALRLGEHDDLNQLNALAGHVTRHGSAFLAWADLVGSPSAAAEDAGDRFEEAFQGEFDSAESYGEQLLDDMGVDIVRIETIPEFLRSYVSIDVVGWVRDMSFNGEIDIVGSRKGSYVFLAT